MVDKEEYLVVELPNSTSDVAIRHTVELKKYAHLGWRLVTVVGRLAYLKRPVTPDPLYVDIAQLKAIAESELLKDEVGWKSWRDGHEQGGYGDLSYETVGDGYVFYRQGKKVHPFDLLKELIGEVTKRING